MMPTDCWVVIAKDRNGDHRGFEKSSERFHLVEREAIIEHKDLGDLAGHFEVVPCVIMTVDDYNEMSDLALEASNTRIKALEGAR